MNIGNKKGRPNGRPLDLLSTEVKALIKVYIYCEKNFVMDNQSGSHKKKPDPIEEARTQFGIKNFKKCLELYEKVNSDLLNDLDRTLIEFSQNATNVKNSFKDNGQRTND